MDDLISRRAAIDKIREVYEYEFPTASGAFDEFVTVIIPNLLRNLSSAQPERRYDEWCNTCKEYDQEKHCCPRWNRVIRTTLQEAQRTGRWIDGKVKHIKNGELRNVRECSECGSSYFVYDYYNSVDEIPKFCPNCGARMEEEDGNQS